MRDAINAAVVNSAIDSINFSVNGTITLIHGELVIPGKTLTIDATGHNITVKADSLANDPTPGVMNGDGVRIFNIVDTSAGGENPPEVTLIGLTLTGGDVSGNGGAIYSEARLVVQDCAIESNFATTWGGGIFQKNLSSTSAFEMLQIKDSRVQNNKTSGDGAGIHANLTRGTLTVESSTFTNNQATSGVGGGITVRGNHASLDITSSTISGNSAWRGGGIYAAVENGSVTISRTKVNGLNTAVGYESAGAGAYLIANSNTHLTITETDVGDWSSPNLCTSMNERILG